MTVAETIYKLREENHLSQAEFANLFHISHQAVQKWENGTTQPSLGNIIAVARHFHVSLDALLLQGDIKNLSEMREAKGVEPDYAVRDDHEAYTRNLLSEYRQSIDEGLDLGTYKSVFEAVSKMPESREKEKIADVLFEMVLNAPAVKDYPYEEPSNIEGIRALREAFSVEGKVPDREVLKDKIKGAWYGRICGCLLGKPVEGISSNMLAQLLKATGNYPMHKYILNKDISDETCEQIKANLRERCWADTVDNAPMDDDTNYTVLSQILIDRYGRNFAPEDVGNIWLTSQPKVAYCTAERVTYINLVNGYKPPNTAVYKNPSREWIGAQIRGDYYGYINPGNPELAAEMAWRDASISHIKNGIYGEMFVAAMLSLAAVTDDVRKIICGGLSQIPATSRLHEAISTILAKHENGVSCREIFFYIHEKYDESQKYDWCHTIPNAMIVVASLLYGEGDYGKSICLSVQAGFDTDCNAATVGSVVGMQKGSGAVGPEWTDVVKGKLDTSIFGVGMVNIEDVIDKTMEHVR